MAKKKHDSKKKAAAAEAMLKNLLSGHGEQLPHPTGPSHDIDSYGGPGGGGMPGIPPQAMMEGEPQ